MIACNAEPRVNARQDVLRAQGIVEVFYVKIKSGQQDELAHEFSGRMSSDEAMKALALDSSLGPYVAHEVVTIETNVTTIDGVDIGAYTVTVRGRYEKATTKEALTIMLDSIGYHYDRYTRILH